VFDITKRESLQSLEAHIKEFRLLCPDKAQENVVLVGNKVDLEAYRQVSQTEALEFCHRLNLLQYIETSASSNMNVDLFFYTVALKAYETDQQAQQEHNQDQLFNNMNGGGFAP